MSKTWLTRAWQHLEEGDTYSALEEFNGAIFRCIRTKDFLGAKQTLLEASKALIERNRPHEVRLLALRYKKQMKRTDYFKKALMGLIEIGNLLLATGSYNEGENIFGTIIVDARDDSQIIQACADALNDEKLAKASGMLFEIKTLAAQYYIQIQDYMKAKKIFIALLNSSLEQTLQIQLLTYITLVNLLDSSVEEAKLFLQEQNKFEKIFKSKDTPLAQLTMEVIHAFEERDFNQVYQIKTRFNSIIFNDQTLKRLFQEIMKLRPQSSPMDGLASLFGQMGFKE